MILRHSTLEIPNGAEAKESGGPGVLWVVAELLRGGGAVDAPFAHEGHGVGERERLVG